MQALLHKRRSELQQQQQKRAELQQELLQEDARQVLPCYGMWIHPCAELNSACAASLSHQGLPLGPHQQQPDVTPHALPKHQTLAACCIMQRVD